MLTWQLIIFGYTLWLGLYLIARNPRNPRLSLTGLGLAAYALALGLTLLHSLDPAAGWAYGWGRMQNPILFLPALCWSGVTIYLLPEESENRADLLRVWWYRFLPIALILYGVHLALAFSEVVPQVSAVIDWLIIGLIVFELVATFAVLLIGVWQTRPQRASLIIAVATLFMGLGVGLSLFPLFPWLTESVGLLSIGGDLILLGLCIAVLDAFDEGEALLPDFIRAFGATLLSILMFAGPILIVMLFGTAPLVTLVMILLGVMVVAIIRQTFADYFERWIDKLAFRPFPHLRQAREDLRVASKTLPKIKQSFDPNEISEAEFARLTRRALSHYGDMSRLATSPLTKLPIIEANLARRGVADDTLERAAELKAILTDSISRLKPRDKGDFGTTDEWRYYNALYFPYVLGLKPYSRRAEYDALDEITQEALAWFQVSVPERTLYNWQSTAAKLVAQDLKEQQGGS